jgi:hypothetical protein
MKNVNSKTINNSEKAFKIIIVGFEPKNTLKFSALQNIFKI